MLAARRILAALPASLSSAVVFRLEPLRMLADDDLLRHMFSLSPGLDPGGDSHVVLTPAGPLLATPADGRIRSAERVAALPPAVGASGLLARFGDRLALLPGDEPDCLGVGHLPGSAPVALHVRIQGIHAEAVATLEAAPDPRRLDLLRAVGVEHVGGREVPGAYLAYFHNRLDQHLMAGALAGFTRTDHCNLFFMRQGAVGTDLEQGLLHAAAARIAHARRHTQTAVRQLARDATRRSMALTCVPPPPLPPEPYGDVVPLGFLLAALPKGEEADAVRAVLDRRCHGGLWSFHRGGLPTATDTVLTAQALDDPRTLPALEAFRDDAGGYVPQRWASSPQPGAMLQDPRTAHWCQADLATTCLVLAARRRAGLPSAGTMRWVADRFDTRHGLFFANPFLTDWALAQALMAGRTGQTEAVLARRLGGEILSAQNDDGSFGAYDKALSTSLAILTLATLGERRRPVLLAQLRLLDWITSDGLLPPATPFFSSVQTPVPRDCASPQSVVAGDRLHLVTYYRDDDSLITTALATQALTVVANGDDVVPADSHSEMGELSAEALTDPSVCVIRYQCPNVTSYVTEVVLADPSLPAGPITNGARGGTR